MSVTWVFTDGSSLGNGKKDAAAGYGVFFGEGHPLNESESLTLPPFTNNRAEIFACIRAIQLYHEISSRDDILRIYTDSEYVIKSVTEWMPGWKKKGWKTAAKKPVKKSNAVKEQEEETAEEQEEASEEKETEEGSFEEEESEESEPEEEEAVEQDEEEF